MSNLPTDFKENSRWGEKMRDSFLTREAEREILSERRRRMLLAVVGKQRSKTNVVSVDVVSGDCLADGKCSDDVNVGRLLLGLFLLLSICSCNRQPYFCLQTHAVIPAVCLFLRH